MIKVIYQGSPDGLYNPGNYMKFIEQFEEVDTLWTRKGSRRYNYRIDHIVSQGIGAFYLIKRKSHRNYKAILKVSGKERDVSDFEKIIKKAEEEF